MADLPGVVLCGQGGVGSSDLLLCHLIRLLQLAIQHHPPPPSEQGKVLLKFLHFGIFCDPGSQEDQSYPCLKGFQNVGSSIVDSSICDLFILILSDALCFIFSVP